MKKRTKSKSPALVEPNLQAPRRENRRPSGARARPVGVDGARPRRVAAGDVLPHAGPQTAEHDRVERATGARLTVETLVLKDLLRPTGDGLPASETLKQLQAIIDGASPDEARALRRTDGG